MPFVLAPNVWARFSFIKTNNEYKERAHGDGINFSSDLLKHLKRFFGKLSLKMIQIPQIILGFILIILISNMVKKDT